jgi:hypothetical protein
LYNQTNDEIKNTLIFTKKINAARIFSLKKMIKTQMPEREGRGAGRRRKGWSRRRVEAEFCSLQACIPHLAASTHSRLHILLEAINYIGRVFNGLIWFYGPLVLHWF